MNDLTPPTIDQSVIERALVTQADCEAAAKALGYKDWNDATDYRLTGAQDRQVADMAKAFARHLLASISPSPIAGKEGVVVPYTGAVPPHWTPENKYDRHPKTEADWDYRNDTPETRKDNARRRLNFAMDFRDPRVDDQMTIVHRTDLLDVTHDLIHKNAYWEEHTTPPAECVATPGESLLITPEIGRVLQQALLASTTLVKVLKRPATPGEVGKLCEELQGVWEFIDHLPMDATQDHLNTIDQAATLLTQMEAREQALREAVSAVLPSAAGAADQPDTKVIAFYINMGELRALRALLTGAGS